MQNDNGTIQYGILPQVNQVISDLDDQAANNVEEDQESVSPSAHASHVQTPAAESGPELMDTGLIQ